jgi:hypothetical protein
LSAEIIIIELVDASGKVCGTWNVNAVETQIDLSTYSTGTYSINFKGKEIISSKRITIKK